MAQKIRAFAIPAEDWVGFQHPHAALILPMRVLHTRCGDAIYKQDNNTH